jgi:S1-C subfamily serine protease
LQELGGEAFSAYGIAKDAGGVELIEVPKGSSAARAGLKSGDLLLQINGISVSKIGQVRRLTEQLDTHQLTLKIVRDMAPLMLTLQP